MDGTIKPFKDEKMQNVIQLKIRHFIQGFSFFWQLAKDHGELMKDKDESYIPYGSQYFFNMLNHWLNLSPNYWR